MTDPGDVDRLSTSLAGSEDQCLIPSAHDKLSEAHFFLHEMMRLYHEPHPFRYSLSAFLQAARSSTLMLQKELSAKDGFKEWWAQQTKAMKADPDWKLINDLRVEVVHTSVLVPASSVGVGLFQYGRMKMGLIQLKADPMIPSLPSLLIRRPHASDLYGVHPHRHWSGEELGLERKWSLPDLKGRELVDFCLSFWRKLADVIAAAHEWIGRTVTFTLDCHEWLPEARVIRESQIFPEVARAWEEPPTEEVRPRGESLQLLAHPGGKTPLHDVKATSVIRGWVSSPNLPWPSQFLSMLVYSIDSTPVREGTAVCFDRRQAVISQAPEDEDDRDGEEDPTAEAT